MQNTIANHPPTNAQPVSALQQPHLASTLPLLLFSMMSYDMECLATLVQLSWLCPLPASYAPFTGTAMWEAEKSLT